MDFIAELELATTITAPDKIDTLSYTKELLSAAIPGAGIEVPGIFKLGATLSYEVGFSTTIKGIASFNSGLKTTVPNTAIVSADIKDPSKSTATGFDGGAVTPIFDLTALTANVVLAAFTQPKLAFGVELTAVGTFDVAVVVKLPTVSVTLSAGFSTSLPQFFFYFSQSHH